VPVVASASCGRGAKGAKMVVLWPAWSAAECDFGDSDFGDSAFNYAISVTVHLIFDPTSSAISVN
jgi:hypothetical protein